MPTTRKELTNREKAAILAHKLGIIPTAKAAYLAAQDKAEKDIAVGSLNSYASRFFSNPEVKEFSQFVDRYLADRESDARARGKEEAKREIYASMEIEGEQGGSDRTKSDQPKPVDYYDPANQRRQINRIIAESSDDPKTQLDAIKAIQQTQRDDRQAAQDRRQVQAFLPLRCQNCPLYERAKPKK